MNFDPFWICMRSIKMDFDPFLDLRIVTDFWTQSISGTFGDFDRLWNLTHFRILIHFRNLIQCWISNFCPFLDFQVSNGNEYRDKISTLSSVWSRTWHSFRTQTNLIYRAKLRKVPEGWPFFSDLKIKFEWLVRSCELEVLLKIPVIFFPPALKTVWFYNPFYGKT